MIQTIDHADGPSRRTAPMREAEVAIIGGGIFGLFCALTLAEAGKSVIVLDRSRSWAEASAVNAGSLGVQNKLPALVPYTLWAWDLWAGLEKRLGTPIGLRREGGYKVAMTDLEAERLYQVSREQEALGLTVERLGQNELRNRASWISPECVAATFSPDDGFASPTLVGPALRKAVENAGGIIVEDTRVDAIRRDPGLRIETSRGEFRAEKLAITAGAWSGRLAAMVGVNLPISLDVNMVSVTEPSPRPILANIVTHARGILTLKQVSNGSCLIGGGWQGIGSIDDTRKELDYDQLVHNLRLAMRVIPGLGALNVVRSWAGYEGVTPDSYPYLGQLPGNDDIFCAACARGGFTLGPLMGQLLAELFSAAAHPDRSISSIPEGFPMPQPRMRFIEGVSHSQPAIRFTFEGQSYSGFAGENIVSAMMRAGVEAIRRTRLNDDARGYYCGMGLCWECAVHVEGTGVVRSCNYPLRDGLVISLADSRPAGTAHAETAPPPSEQDGQQVK